MERHDLTFRSGEDHCAAWLYRPDAEGMAGGIAGGDRPVVILGHGLGATKEMGLDAYARRFVEAGFVALAFDYRGFGASTGEPRQWLDVRRQLDDWQAAIDFAHTLERVDATRIALFGSSFGGGHVIRAAARDPRVAAVVAQCPFTDGPASLRAAGLGAVLRMTPVGLHDLVMGRLGRARGIALAGVPGSTALMTSPDSSPGYYGLLPPGAEFDDHVDARIALHVPLNSPGRAAAKVQCPIMFSVCDTDSVAPAKQTVKWASKAPRGEVVRYPFGHFDIYQGEPFERAVADQTDFLVRHLRP